MWLLRGHVLLTYNVLKRALEVVQTRRERWSRISIVGVVLLLCCAFATGSGVGDANRTIPSAFPSSPLLRIEYSDSFREPKYVTFTK